MKADQAPTQTERPAWPFFRHREAVEGRCHRGRGAEDADQARRDRAAGRAADIDADHRCKALQRVEAERKWQHHDDCHRDGDAGQRTADHAGDGADDERQQILPMQYYADVLEQELVVIHIPLQVPRGNSTDR